MNQPDRQVEAVARAIAFANAPLAANEPVEGDYILARAAIKAHEKALQEDGAPDNAELRAVWASVRTIHQTANYGVNNPAEALADIHRLTSAMLNEKGE